MHDQAAFVGPGTASADSSIPSTSASSCPMNAMISLTRMRPSSPRASKVVSGGRTSPTG